MWEIKLDLDIVKSADIFSGIFFKIYHFNIYVCVCACIN